MTHTFKEGEEVLWLVTYVKPITSYAAVNDDSHALETSPGNQTIVHSPKLYPATALDVNKELLKALRQAKKVITKLSEYKSDMPVAHRVKFIDDAIAAAKQANAAQPEPLSLDEYANAFCEVNPSYFALSGTLERGLRAVLDLAGVKYMEPKV